MKEYIIRGNGSALRYHDFPGEKLPIVFIHGLGCAGSFDYPQIAAQPALASHRRILVDLLGAGYSDKPDDFSYTVEDHGAYLLEFIQALNMERFILFGHSLGGAVALSLADRCEDRLHQIILSESNLDESAQGSLSRRVADFDMQDFLSDKFDLLVKEFKEQGNRMWAASLSMWLPKAAYFISKSAAAGGKKLWREILYALKCPRTFIFGEKSLPHPDLQALPQHGVRTEVIKNAGHSMTWKNPEGVATAIGTAIASSAKHGTNAQG